MPKSNIFDQLPDKLPEEFFETLVQSDKIKIERIVSKGQCSADDFWYDQEQSEWVMVLQGEASIAFEDHEVTLSAGDYINIPAHQKHRVAWTHPDMVTVWLAVFY